MPLICMFQTLRITNTAPKPFHNFSQSRSRFQSTTQQRSNGHNSKGIGRKFNKQKQKQAIHILATAMTAMICTFGVTYMTPTFLIFFPLVPSYMKFWRHFNLAIFSKKRKIKMHQNLISPNWNRR